MKNRTETIRRIVGYLNNPDFGGGFWLPNIQRPFVWSEEQISRLFDSIMRQYPISTLLVWKTMAPVRHRRFVDCYKSSMKLSDFFVPNNEKAKQLVLDGQQRLQSLYIGLVGSYEGKELYFNILSGDLVAPEDIRYDFVFMDPTDDPKWVRFKVLVFSDLRDNRMVNKLCNRFQGELTPEEMDRIEDNVCQVSKVFKQDEVIVYQELDSIDNKELYSDDDVVEIFIRANAGGTRLGKSDLLFSLLSSIWDESDAQMETLLDELNGLGYSFSRDFVLKTCLTLLKTGAAYNVKKLRDPDNRQRIVDNWPEIGKAIKDVRDYLYENTYIRSDKALPSYLGLIPIIYYRYHYERQWSSAKGIDDYILRTLLASSFSGNPDRLIDACIDRIDQLQGWDTREIFGVIRSHNRSLEITPEVLLSQGYGSKLIHLVFNLWYKQFNYTPALSSNEPQVDHIFPQSLLRTVKRKNPETGRNDLLRYYAPERDQLANCMLLKAGENGAGNKGNIPPDEWFADKDHEYLAMHLIPRDPSLWRLDAYEEFIEARKKLILEKMGTLLIKSD